MYLLNVVNSHKTMPEHKYQLCQHQEVDGAATTLINLSIALQEVGGGDKGDTDWECRHTDVTISVWFQDGPQQKTCLKVKVFAYLLEVLEDADMSGKTTKKGGGL